LNRCTPTTIVPLPYDDNNNNSEDSSNLSGPDAGAVTDVGAVSDAGAVVNADAVADGDFSESMVGISGYAQEVNIYEDNDICIEHDKVTSPSCGDKHPRSLTDSDQLRSVRQPVKLHVTTGTKPKAGDYEVAVKAIIMEANTLYRGHLSVKTPYPTLVEEADWAASSWDYGCKKCHTQMACNDELIGMVRDIN
jgi:hypothetical protein